jgi:hypothetical protein
MKPCGGSQETHQASRRLIHSDFQFLVRGFPMEKLLYQRIWTELPKTVRVSLSTDTFDAFIEHDNPLGHIENTFKFMGDDNYCGSNGLVDV